MDLFLKRSDAKEVKVNWLQDVGPIYSDDKYEPNRLFYHPKSKKEEEYIWLFCYDQQEAIAFIDHIIKLNGGKDKFFKQELEGWSHLFNSKLFHIGYRNELMSNFVLVELQRQEKREVVSYGNDKSEILYGIHKDSKKINSIIKGLNSIVYNSGEMDSGGGELYFVSSGSHIVSYWSDIKKAVGQFKSIVDCYPENAINKDWMGSETEIKDFSYENLLEIINDEGFLIEFKTDDFKINLSQGNSSFQMNFYLNEIIIEDKKDIHKKNIEETPPPILKFNNETLRTSVKVWLEDDKKAEAKYGHISNWDTSEVTDMSKLFLDAHTFNENLNNWDVSKVSNMHAMFDNAYVFNQPLNNWDVSKVTNMGEMFSSMESLAFNQPIGDWDVSSVVNMAGMFSGAAFFNQPIGYWDVSNVTDMRNMFQGTNSFNQLIGDWDMSNVTDMSYMFHGATSFNQPIGQWDVSKVTEMQFMFSGAKAFNQPIGNWNVSRVLDMSAMFSPSDDSTAASSFNQPIENWDVSNVIKMAQMFSDASAFNQPIGKWNVNSVITMHGMFHKATSFNQPIGDWDVSMVNDMSHMFSEATSFNQPIGDWDVKSLKDMRNMFHKATSFNQSIDKWKLTTDDTLWERAAYKEEIKDYKGAIVDYKKAIAANPSKTEFYRFCIDNCESEIAGIDTSLPAQLERSGIDLESIDSESGYNIITKALEKTTTTLNNRDSNTYDVLRSRESSNPDHSLLHDSLRNEIERSLETLTSREAEVIRLYFGLGNQQPMELDEIGEAFKLTTERTRQIKEKAIRRIKHTTKSKILKTYLS